MGDGASAIGKCPSGDFPTFDKGCTSTDNCSFGLHQNDCCGSQFALGFNHAFKNAFDSAEQTWRGTCDPCLCMPSPTKTESGLMTCDASRVAVKCATDSTCVTYCN
jgi:hypothetical protein